MAFMYAIAAGVSSYIITSVILLCYPRILYRSPKIKARPCKHISHRGGAGENYENTLKAFKQ